MPRPPRPAPREQVGDWTCDLDLDTSLYDLPEVAVALGFVRNLRKEVNGRSSREIERITGVNFTTINKILRGQTWPDMVTIARLESGLGADLWPKPPDRVRADAHTNEPDGGRRTSQD